MVTIAREVSRFSACLFVKGALMLLGGIAALVWPDTVLVRAMLITAVLLAVTGLFEMALAVQLRRSTRAWPLAFADGAASVGWALISVTITVVPLRTTMLLVALWLGAYGLLAGALAVSLWPMRRSRNALLALTVVDVVLAVLAATNTGASIFTLLYVGAGYAITFGAFQLLAGVWTRSVALPEVEPTVQSGWQPARHF